MGSNEYGLFLESTSSIEFFPFESFQRIIIKKEDMSSGVEKSIMSGLPAYK